MLLTWIVNMSWIASSLKLFIVYLIIFLDEFETPATPKPKETEAQPEPEDGGEDGREEGY